MSRPWMPFYVTDYLIDTKHLSTEQHGVYVLLLMAAWRRGDGAIPNDPKWIRANLPPMHGRTYNAVVPPILSEFFTLGEDGKYHSRRMEKEIEKASKLSRNQSEKASKRWSQDKENKDLPNAAALPLQLQLQRKKEEDTPKGVSKLYAFENGIIRLKQSDFDRWKASFSHLELAAELLSLSPWAEGQGKNWFHAVQGALAKRNREVKARKDSLAEQGGFKWNGFEGVI